MTALLVAILFIVVAGSVFAITGIRQMPSVSLPTSSISATALSSARSAGLWIPYVLLIGGPMLDVAYQDFRYTLLTFISMAAMALGFVYQIILHGPGDLLPGLTVGTSAAITYLIQDAWLRDISEQKKITVTIGGILAILLTALVMSISSIGKSSIMNDMVAILLGAGFGELAWVIVYNVARDRLPFAKG